MKQFVTAATEADAPEGEDEIEFEIDGVMCRAYRPTEGQLAVFMASTSRVSSIEENIAGVINFFASVLDEASNSYIVARLLNRKDPFGLKQVQEIIQYLISEWSARPTQSPSGSTGSQQSTGETSTPSTPALTS